MATTKAPYIGIVGGAIPVETQSLDSLDVQRVVRALPSKLRAVIQASSDLVVVAGGFVRSVVEGSKPRDIDLFVSSPVVAQYLAREIADVMGSTVTQSHKSYTVHHSTPIQVVHKYSFSSPSSVLESFDYTIAQASVWCVPEGEEDYSWRGICAGRFYTDLAAKRLVYTMPDDHDVGGSVYRMTKFLKRGYTILPVSASQILARLYTSVSGNPVDFSKEIMARVFVVPPTEYPDFRGESY